MAVLQVNVVSAERSIWSGEAAQVIARTVEGEIGILAGHEPMLATLGIGEVRVTTASGERIAVDAEGGFLSVDHNSVQIIAGNARLIS